MAILLFVSSLYLPKTQNPKDIKEKSNDPIRPEYIKKIQNF
jgi:CRISPR/Cas system CSM-associated protein Csm4 (group 5 of RAMP superfamily)